MDFQLITLREELSRLHQDNRKLRSMLDQITKNYSELQGQLLMGMQKQAQQNRQEQVNIYVYMFFLFFFS
jgi:phage shock protein A